MVELLSPAGDFECLKVAVKANCDAVYVGLNNFSARANAVNFDKEHFKEAIDYCHLRNKKIYLAMNTLIFDNEIQEALESIYFAYKEGIDAVIVQDIGLMYLIKKYFPKLSIHASTQMTVHDSYFANLLKGMDIKRVVLSRELNLEQIKNIKKNTGIEVEVFVHGALCISYSGQCLFSSIIGKRSGNRGQCAQPCRMKYTYLNSGKEGYLLSPKDICLIEDIPNLIKIGVDAFKIEGRLKDKYYVYTVTSIYRKAIEMFYEKGEVYLSSEDREKLLLVFNRGNFSKGYLYGAGHHLIHEAFPNNTGVKIGQFSIYKGNITIEIDRELINNDIIVLRKENFEVALTINNNLSELKKGIYKVKTNKEKVEQIKLYEKGDVYLVKSTKLIEEVENSLQKEYKARKVDFYIDIKLNEKAKVIAKSDNFVSKIEKHTIETSKKISIDEKRIIDSFSKIGDTPFYLNHVRANVEENAFLKISQINDLKREAISNLSDIIVKSYKREMNFIFNEKVEITPKSFTQISFMIEYVWQFEMLKNLKHDNIFFYIPYKLAISNDFSIIEKKAFYFDRVMTDDDLSNIDIKILKKNGFKIALARSLGQISFLKNSGFEIYADYSLNIVNSFSIRLLEELGVKRACLSYELAKYEIAQISSQIETEVVVFSYIPLMINEIRFYQKGEYIKDRIGNKFPLKKTQFDRNEILNTLPLFIDYESVSANIARFDISFCNCEQIMDIINYIDNKIRLKGRYTKGHYERGELL